MRGECAQYGLCESTHVAEQYIQDVDRQITDVIHALADSTREWKPGDRESLQASERELKARQAGASEGYDQNMRKINAVGKCATCPLL
jgi:hypothetical protein